MTLSTGFGKDPPLAGVSLEAVPPPADSVLAPSGGKLIPMRPAKLILAVLLFSAAVFAASPAQIDDLIAKYKSLGLFNGSALVADQGQVVLKKGYGLANMEWDIPNAPDTKFRLGSVTKQFTATLVLQLVEQGKLELNAPITRYLPNYPQRTGDRITIHHLLNHTSGIPGYTELPDFGEKSRDPYRPEKFIDMFAKLDLFFEPGTRFSYSNSGYFLLGVILEKVTGQPYEKLLRERIFNPAGMNDSGYDSTSPLLAKRAAGYDKHFDGSYTNTGYLDMTQPYAAGSLYSTVEDLYRWDQALYGEKILSAASKAKMFTPGLSNYGYAFTITKKDGVTTIEHGGGINGFNTVISRNPETKRLIVLLNNTGAAPLNQMTAGIRAVLDGKKPEYPKEPAAPVLFKTYQTSGLDAAMKQAAEMKAGSQYDAGMGEVIRFAGQVLAKGNKADALTAAKKIMESAPKSAGAATLLARAEEANGHRFEAIQAWSKVIELSDTRGLLMYTDEIRRLSDLEHGAK
jgi:CubicO group peptidase (beta-lactamase class C family)